MVILKDKKEWTSAKSFPELAAKMSKSLEAVPGISTGFQYPVQMRFNELMTGARQDVVCKIFGEDLDSLAHYAQQFGELIKTVNGAEDLYIEPITGMPQILIHYKRAAIAQYQLDLASVNRVVHMAFAGQSAGKIYEGEKRFDLVVRLDEDQRENITDIRNLLIPLPNGAQLPLYQLADVTIQNGPAQIQREDTKRRIVVGFNVRGRDVQGIVKELQQKVEGKLKLAPGYAVTYGGAFENLNQAKARLLIAVPLSLVLIFILLFFAFHSVKQSLIIYSAIPLSAIGGIFFLALRGMPFSISAGVGFIALFGVAVLNGIVLIAEFTRLQKEGETDLFKVVLTGTRTRLRPVLMTAFVASLGFLPMALSNGAGAEVQRPLATVVIGGLMIATFLTLFVLPVLYILFDRLQLPTFKGKRKLAVLAILFSLATPAMAQQHISLDEALLMAEKNNLSNRSKVLQAAYQETRIATAFDLPQASLTAEIGQTNSAIFDNRVGIAQSMNFPTVYTKQKKQRKAEWDAAVMAGNLNQLSVKKTVTELFYYILVLRDKQKMLNRVDSLYASFLEKADLRLEKGESNLLEQTAAALQRQQIVVQQKGLENEITLAKMQLQLLLNAQVAYEPIASGLVFNSAVSVAKGAVDQHPAVQLIAKDLAVAAQGVELEKAKLLPNLTVGYFNQSFRDIGKQRFSAVEVGIGIPLFSAAQKAQIRVQQQQVLLVEQEYESQKIQWTSRRDMALQQWQTKEKMVANYRDHQLPLAEKAARTAQLQFEKGEINYLEWVVLNNQALQIQNEYFDLLMELNQWLIELDFLQS